MGMESRGRPPPGRWRPPSRRCRLARGELDHPHPQCLSSHAASPGTALAPFRGALYRRPVQIFHLGAEPLDLTRDAQVGRPGKGSPRVRTLASTAVALLLLAATPAMGQGLGLDLSDDGPDEGTAAEAEGPATPPPASAEELAR